MKLSEKRDALRAAFAAKDKFDAERERVIEALKGTNLLNLESIMKLSETGTCCLCGGDYEHFGNNPEPLARDSAKSRCCDACNEIVTEARIFPEQVQEEMYRVQAALDRMPSAPSSTRALAAICASRGPVKWEEKKAMLAKLRELNNEPSPVSETP